MRHLRGQRGISLVGLMVGLVISVLAVLAALQLYRSTIKTMFSSGGLVPASQQDGQLASGMLSAQMALQGAGFGIGSAASGTHFLLLQSASFDLGTQRLAGTVQAISAAAASGNALVWISNAALSGASSDYRCHALVSDTSTRAFYLLQSTGACAPLSTQWNAITWTWQTLVQPHLMAQAITMRVRNAAGCWPFGAVPDSMSTYSAPSASVRVDLGYQGSTTGASNTYTSCLTNLSA